jgi:hypothetical protein
VKTIPSNNFSTVPPIFTIHIPIDSGCEAEKSECFEKVPSFTLKQHVGIFYFKNTPQNNFSTNEPISTNNTPIDSLQPAKTHRNLKNFQNSFKGSNRVIFAKKYRLE